MASSALPLVRHTLRRSRWSVIGWSSGLAAACLLYLPIYPSMKGSGELENLVASLPSELVSTFGFDAISTGAGYTQASLYGLLGFILTTIAAVGWGAATIGGEEVSGALELTLAHGVTRLQVALEASLALAVRPVIVCSVLAVTVLALNGPSQLDLTAANVIAGSLALYLLSLRFGFASITAGALTGSRTASIVAGATVAVLAYALNTVGNQTESTQWLRSLSPYSWVFGSTPLASGFSEQATAGMAVTLGICGLLVLVSAVGLHRRDIGR